jgi:FdhE protein
VNPFDARIRRAELLPSKYPYAAEILRFYVHIAKFQRDLHGRLSRNREIASRVNPTGALREELFLPPLIREYPEILRIVSERAPAPLAAHAKQLAEGRDREAHWSEMLTKYWADGCRHEPALADERSTFCARAFLAPVAELLAGRHAMPPGFSKRMACPLCDGAPQASVLRPEGDGGKRTLLCSFCGTEWEFVRIVCASCGEEDEKKLCFYTAEEPDYIRVEACETCRRYMLTIDMTKNGLAVPVVDELAAVPLDLWAKENGYTKIQPNLFGM